METAPTLSVQNGPSVTKIKRSVSGKVERQPALARKSWGIVGKNGGERPLAKKVDRW